MPTFDYQSTLPATERYIPPQYLNEKKGVLALAGYDRRGKRNLWGKIMGAVAPGMAAHYNDFAKSVANKYGAEDTAANIGDQKDDLLAQSKLYTDTALAVAKPFLGPVGGAAASAVGGATTTGDSTVEDVTEYNPDGTIKKKVQKDTAVFRYGGKMKCAYGGKFAKGGDVANSIAGDIPKISGDIAALMAMKKAGQLGANLKDDGGYSLQYDYEYGGKPEKMMYGGLMGIAGDLPNSKKKFASGGVSKAKAREILHDGTAQGHPLTPKQQRFFGWMGYGKHAMGGMADAPRIYSEDDDTEDLHMIDKRTGEKVGEMRYEERIFSQIDSMVMEKLAAMDMVRALGEYTKLAIQKHEMMEDCAEDMAEGEDMGEEDDTEEDKMGGRVGRMMRRGGIFRFAEGGILGGDPKKKRQTALDKARALFEDSNTGDVSYQEDINTPQSDYSTGKYYDVPAMPETGQSYGRLTPNDYLGIASDLGGAAYGAFAASTPPPQWEVPQRWTDALNQAQDYSHQGFTADENLAYQNASDRSYDQQVAAIGNYGTVGSQGAQLAALNAAGANKQDAAVQLAAANAQQKRQNFRQYVSMVPQDVQYDRAKFTDALGEYEKAQAANLGLLDESLQSINDRVQFANAYGPGSSYDKLMGTLGENSALENERLKKVFIGQKMAPMQADMMVAAPIPDTKATADTPDKVMSAPIVVPAPSAPVTPPTKDQIKTAQTKLKAAGYNPRGIDGILGKNTKFALAQYAKAKGITEAEALIELTK